MNINRRTFLRTAGYAAVTSFSACLLDRRDKPTGDVRKKPNHLEKVLLIGIDGLRPDALQEAHTPHIDNLVAEGAYSFAARTGEYTISFPGWSNIFTGVWENKHGVFANPANDVRITANYGQYPSFFTRAKQYRSELTTASLVSWGSINDFIIRNLDRNIHHSYEKEKEGTDKHIAEDAALILRKENPDLMFVYLVNVDGAGHTHGYGSLDYLKSVEQTDAHVGRVIEALRQRPRHKQENWLTLLISDHGGKGKSHDGVGEEARRIPFIMHGPSVMPGEIIPAPTHAEVAPTVLTHLRIPVKDEWGLDGKVVGLRQEKGRPKIQY